MTEIALGDDGLPRNTWKPPTRAEIVQRTPDELVKFMEHFADGYAEAVAMSGPDSVFTESRRQCMRDVFRSVVWYLAVEPKSAAASAHACPECERLAKLPPRRCSKHTKRGAETVTGTTK